MTKSGEDAAKTNAFLAKPPPLYYLHLQKVACTEEIRRCQQGGSSCTLLAVSHSSSPGPTKKWGHNSSFTLAAIPTRARLRQAERVCPAEAHTMLSLQRNREARSISRAAAPSPRRTLPTASQQPNNPALLPATIHTCVVFEREERG